MSDEITVSKDIIGMSTADLMREISRLSLRVAELTEGLENIAGRNSWTASIAKAALEGGDALRVEIERLDRALTASQSQDKVDEGNR